MNWLMKNRKQIGTALLLTGVGILIALFTSESGICFIEQLVSLFTGAFFMSLYQACKRHYEHEVGDDFSI